MKIGLFTDTYVPEVNGVVSVLKMTARELRREGHEVYVFCPSHPDRDESGTGLYDFPSLRFAFYKGMRMAIPYNRSAFRLIPSLDIIHSHTPSSIGLMGLLASKRYHIPHVHTYHTLYMDYRRYLPRVIRPSRGMVKSMSRFLCNRCDSIIAPSHQMKNELESYGITRPVYVLSFGVDEEEFSHEIRWKISEELGIHTKDLLLYVGRVGMEKNLDFLLRSFRQLLSLRPEARLIIAGDGPQREFLKKYALDLGIASFVTFIGYLKRHDLVDLYKQALFVFASKTETQGLVLVEAMMAGAAVVAVGIMGPRDIITSGVTGILVGEDENEFARACNRLLQDDNERQRIGTAAREWARSQSSQVSTKRLLDIYSRCFSGSQPDS
ncbi:MAG: glycosyltransferase [Dehalococcoidales bacterium]|nr:glycosyltransferase [Dehalococcoidales bacterium]